jgi:hypothetical protein
VAVLAEGELEVHERVQQARAVSGVAETDRAHSIW